MEVDANGDSTKIMVMVDRGAKETFEELKGFVSTRAKRNGKSLGEEGLNKIRTALVTMFSDQGVQKDPRMKKIMEEETEADKDDQDPLEKAVLTIGKMFQETVVKALGANGNQNASGTESTGTTGGSNPGSPQRKKRRNDPLEGPRRNRTRRMPRGGSDWRSSRKSWRTT